MLEPALERPFTVVAKSMATPRMALLCLRPLQSKLTFAAGQYVVLTDASGVLPPRSYSIANAPRQDGTIDLLVSAVESGETSGWILNRLAVGEEASLAGPYGNFTIGPQDSGPRLYLAGGAGLAPILALLEDTLERARLAAWLIFSARTEVDVACRERLLEWQASWPWFRFLRTLTRAEGPPPLGRIPTILPGLFPKLDGYSIFSAGGPGFVDACAAAAIRLGAAEGRVHTEAFFSEPQPW
ncbi:MAG: FAD-binding oxidoreductase [Candidatus Dormibacteria bacterium]